MKYYFSLSLADFDNEVQYDDEMGYAYTDINFMFYVSFDIIQKVLIFEL